MELVLVDQPPSRSAGASRLVPGHPVVPQPVVTLRAEARPADDAAPALITRYAPAPTGYLHLGHVLNAVYVWGVARRLGGRVLLRIEGTIATSPLSLIPTQRPIPNPRYLDAPLPARTPGRQTATYSAPSGSGVL